MKNINKTSNTIEFNNFIVRKNDDGSCIMATITKDNELWGQVIDDNLYNKFLNLKEAQNEEELKKGL